MVQTANLRNGDDPTSFQQLDQPRLGRVLSQSEVRAASMIIGDEALKMAVQAGFVEHDHMVQAFATKSADHTFDVGALPWRARRRQHLFDSHRLRLENEVAAEDSVAVTQEIAWCA